jgi:hypothetical protein
VPRSDDRQTEFLLAESLSAKTEDTLALPHPQAALFTEIAATWEVPLGQNIRVTLSGHAFYELTGRLEIAAAPDLPLDRRHLLQLRIGEFTFTHRQITDWITA